MAYVAELRNTTSDKQLLQDAVDEIRRLVAQEFQVGSTFACSIRLGSWVGS